MLRNRLLQFSIASSAILLAVCGCSKKEPLSPHASPSRPEWIVTIHPLAAILKELIGDAGEIVELLPPNASPHTYEPRPSDLTRTGKAKALFYVGEHLDGWASRLSCPYVVEFMSLVPPEDKLNFNDQHADHEHEGVADPHFWTDPICLMHTFPGLVHHLGQIDPPNADLFRRNAEAFAQKLDVLNLELESILEPVENRAVVLFHPSFNYMLNRYSFSLAGSIEPFPGKEPSPKYLQSIIDLLKEKQIRAIFKEPQLPARPAEVIAEAAGLKVYELDPNGGVPGRQTYSEIMLYNARTLSEALK